MDAPLSARGSARPIKRGRGAGTSIRGRSSNLSSTFNNTGNAAASGSTKRKLAGTPLFHPASDAESGDDSAATTTGAAAMSSKRSRNAAAAAASTSMIRGDSNNAGDSDAEQAARKSRFEVTASENRYLQLKPLREKERKDAIAAGLIPDPLKPRRLDEALTFLGTCEDMCPEFEREEREFQKNVDKWETNPGSNRIVRQKAVKAFHRPAAGNEQPMPSDVRPPRVLKRVLDYLFHDILSQDPEMTESHPFLRDRTRAVRQDFTMQHERGPMAIECHERIARYHILCLHVLREWENFSESQELEQLRKVLQSLNEFYDDARLEGLDCPHEAEFRAYYLITHLRDSDTIRQTECLPFELFNSQHIQAALRLQSLALRNNESRGERGRRPANSEASLNAFSRFFKQVAKDETSYLLACLAESHFTDVRRGALVAMRKAYIPQNPQYPICKLAKMLGCNDVQHGAEIAETFGLNVTKGAAGVPVSVELHKQVALQEYPSIIKQRTSKAIVEVKRGKATIQSIIDGQFYSSHVELSATTKHIPKDALPAKRIKAASPTVKKSAFNSPPSSAPATPAVQSPAPTTAGFSFKQPVAATSKLSAVAPAFQPPTPAAKPAVSGFGNFGQTSAFGEPASPAPPTVRLPTFTKPESVPAPRPPLQPVQPTPTAQLQHARKPSRKVSSPTLSSQPVAGTSRKVPSTSVPPISASGKSLLNKALPQLLDLLLSEHVEHHSRTAAIDGLSSVHAQETAVLVAERQTVVEQCASELLDQALDDFAGEKAEYIVAELYDRRNTLRRQTQAWKKALSRAREVRAEIQERSTRFKSLATHLSTGSARATRRRSYADDTLPDLSMLDLSGNLTGTRLSQASTATTSSTRFWQSGTLSNFICSAVDATFASMAPTELPDWKCVVVVPSLDDPVATWYRCKLKMGPEDEGSVVMKQNVRIEFALVSEDELDGIDLRNVGLVIANVTETSSAVGQIEDLSHRLAKEPVYMVRMLQATWSDGLDGVRNPNKNQEIDVGDVNGGLALPLFELLESVVPNSALQVELSPGDLAAGYIHIWKSGLQQAVMRAALRQDSSLWHQVLSRFVDLLQDMCDRLDEDIDFDDEERRIHIPDLNADVHRNSVLDTLAAYLKQLKAQDSLALAYLSSRLEAASSVEEQIATFFDALATAVLDSYGNGFVADTLAEDGMQADRADYQQAVDDAVAALARSTSNEAGKKRRRPTLPSSTETSFVSPTKRSKEGTAMNNTSAWKPDRLSSLSSLIKETKMLLGS